MVSELLSRTCGNSSGDIAAREGLCKALAGLSWTPQTPAGKGGCPWLTREQAGH